jgi:hypothetical protein
LFILLLATRPTLLRRGFRLSGIAHQLPLALQRSHARDVSADRPNARRIRELARRKLKA